MELKHLKTYESYIVNVPDEYGKVGIDFQSDFDEENEGLKDIIENEIIEIIADKVKTGELKGDISEFNYKCKWYIQIEYEYNDEIGWKVISNKIRQGIFSGVEPTFKLYATVK